MDDTFYEAEPAPDTDRLFGNGQSDSLDAADGDALDSLNGGEASDACSADEGDRKTSCETDAASVQGDPRPK